MTYREREISTLNFIKTDRGSVEETFYPWDLTASRFADEGLPKDIYDNLYNISNNNECEKYFPVSWGDGILGFEQHLGFDPVRRVQFVLPFRRFDEAIIEETPDHVIRRDIFGKHLLRKANSEIETEIKSVIESREDWERLKEFAQSELLKNYSDEKIHKAYSPLVEGHNRGDYSIRLNIEGFFWTPRELMGIEKHLFAFYDDPELIHNINEFILEIYTTRLMVAIDILQPDVVYIMEDLSGKLGPMLSAEFFDAFVGRYYTPLIAMLKEHGVKNVFVDTDGDFTQIIPNFINVGVDGFLPMDVNAGMDIVKVREQFPKLKFIGGFNKLMIAEGKEAIDKEFERLMPVIRGGGYIVGSDHQVAPSTSLLSYKYYIEKLKKAMAQSGADL